MAKLALPTVLALGGALLLGGCNIVMSDHPVFATADTSGAPALKPGVWAMPLPGCTFDEAAPATAWPKCANGGVITADQMGEPLDPKVPPPGERKVASYILAAGDPVIMQDRGELPGDGGATKSLYFFIAIKPLKTDPAGKVVTAEEWVVLCGPPAKKVPQPVPSDPNAERQDDGTMSVITEHPLPGMKVVDGVCQPADKAAVRGAAKASRDWAEALVTARWVRDGQD
jgi:hypothetical protein